MLFSRLKGSAAKKKHKSTNVEKCQGLQLRLTTHQKSS